MLNKYSKLFLIVYIILLSIILFISSENFGLGLIVATEFIALIISILITKKIRGSLPSKMLVVIFVSLILYLLIGLSYGLSNIGVGHTFWEGDTPPVGEASTGMLFFVTQLTIIIFLGLSILTNIILVIVKKDYINEFKLKKILIALFTLLIIILLPMYYNTIITKVVKLTDNSNFCSGYFELDNKSFIFEKGLRANCYYQSAVSSLDPNLCNKIEGTATYRYIKNINGKPEYNYLFKDKCFSDIALALNKEDSCYYITDESKRNLCLYDVAVKSNKTDVCYKITDLYKDSCLSQFAKKDSNYLLCGDINIDNVYHVKDACYLDVVTSAKFIGDPELCNYISNNDQRYTCYSKNASFKKDVSICEKYFPTDEVLWSVGVNPNNNSKKLCEQFLYY